MGYNLREWIDKLESEGELKRVKAEVDWRGELAAITRKVFTKRGPAVLFENIKDYKNGLCSKLFIGGLATKSRIAMNLGLPRETPTQSRLQQRYGGLLQRSIFSSLSLSWRRT